MRVFFRNTKPFGQIVALFLFLMAGFVVSTLVNVGLMIAGVEIMQDTNALRWIQILSQLFMFALPSILWVICFGESMRNDLQLHFCSKYWMAALVGLGCYLLAVPFINAVTNWNQSWVLPQPFEDICRQMTEQSEAIIFQFLVPTENIGVLLFNLLVVAVTPAICEELFFRGALQTIMVRWLRNPHVAILIVSFVFSIFHGDVYGFVPRFLLGMLLGYLYYYSGSLLVSALVHFINNAVAVLCYYLYYEHNVAAANPEVQTSIAGWIVVLCTVFAVSFFYYFFVLKCKKSELIEKEIE